MQLVARRLHELEVLVVLGSRFIDFEGPEAGLKYVARICFEVHTVKLLSVTLCQLTRRDKIYLKRAQKSCLDVGDWLSPTQCK